MNMLYLTIVFPLIGFMLLTCFRHRWSENSSAIIGIGSVGLAMLTTVCAGISFFNKNKQPINIPLWNWICIDDFNVNISLMLDNLSLVMLFTTIGVGFLIHIFSFWYIHGKENYSRFFACTNLFIASMTILVLADNLLVMYLGWEGVGLCSYLLIDFYHKNLKNNVAAMKSFITTRISDVFLIFALFILYNEFNTFNFQKIGELATTYFKPSNNNLLQLATIMLLGGAVGKSAQVPLQTWLTDAMVGPAPVSAMIHAATMVTAGVYLVVRTHELFLMTPKVLYLAGIIGIITIILGGFNAMVQSDIKRILAYSTMSQVGYMFLAIGIQAWNAAIFHLMTHAFYKALLFLSSGSLVLACCNEQNIFKMGGLRKSIPLIYVCFLVGGSALSALPLVTSGFFSKDKILFMTMINGHNHLMIIGLIGTFMTSIYIFRMIFVIFHGEKKIFVFSQKGIAHNLPLIILLFFSTFIGAKIIAPLCEIFPTTMNELNDTHIVLFEIVSGMVTVLGILVSAWIWLGKHKIVERITNNVIVCSLRTFFQNANMFGFDWLYHIVFVRSFLYVAELIKYDPLNKLMNIPWSFFIFSSNRYLLSSQNGYLRWYVATMSIGAVVVLVLLMLFH